MCCCCFPLGLQGLRCLPVDPTPFTSTMVPVYGFYSTRILTCVWSAAWLCSRLNGCFWPLVVLFWRRRGVLLLLIAHQGDRAPAHQARSSWTAAASRSMVPVPFDLNSPHQPVFLVVFRGCLAGPSNPHLFRKSPSSPFSAGICSGPGMCLLCPVQYGWPSTTLTTLVWCSGRREDSGESSGTVYD